MNQSGLRLLLVDCHVQRGRDEFDLHVIPHRSADDGSAAVGGADGAEV
jgi:hypothetical protein